MIAPNPYSIATQMEDVLRNLPSGVVVFDAAGQVAQINPALPRIVQIAPASGRIDRPGVAYIF